MEAVAAPPRTAASPAHGARRGRREVVQLLAAYALSRVLVYAAMGLVTYLHLSGARCGDVLGRPIVGFSGLARCWDTTWFLRTADEGYPTVADVGGNHQSTLAFFPGWPALIRAVSAVGVPPLVAALGLSVLLGAAATLLVREMGRDLAGDDVGNRAALLFCFFPGALVLSWGYSEALAATLVAGALLLLRRHRWLLAGLCAAGAGATRADVGLALCAAAGVAAYLAVRARREWRSLWALVLAPLGALGYLGYVWVHTGSPTAWTTVQLQGWNQRFDLGANAASTAWRAISRPTHTAGTLIALLGLLLLVGIVVALVRHPVPAPWLAYVVVFAVLGLMSMQVGFRPRAELLLLPAFVAAAAVLPTRATGWVVGAFAVLQALLVIAFLGVPYVPPP